jgi:hypothetical protein
MSILVIKNETNRAAMWNVLHILVYCNVQNLVYHVMNRIMQLKQNPTLYASNMHVNLLKPTGYVTYQQV